MWIAIQLVGDEWFWIPQEANSVSNHQEWPPDSFVDVLVNGKIWRVTKYQNGNFSFQGNIYPDLPPSGWSVLFVCLSVAALVASALFALHGSEVSHNARDELANEKARRSNAEQCLKSLQDDQATWLREFDREKSEFEKEKQKSNKELASLRQGLNAERGELDQEKKTFAIALRDYKLQRKAPTREDWETASETVRAKAFAGQATGNGIVVNHFFDPKRSGLLIFQWEITYDRPIPPKLVCFRDGEVFRKESGMIRGDFSETLLEPNKRYRYKFALSDRGRFLPDPVIFDIVVPPFRACAPEPPKTDSDEERRRKKEAWRQEQYRYVESFIKDPAKLKVRKAEIDEQANTKFGEN